MDGGGGGVMFQWYMHRVIGRVVSDCFWYVVYCAKAHSDLGTVVSVAWVQPCVSVVVEILLSVLSCLHCKMPCLVACA
jgi:hypothetical protein